MNALADTLQRLPASPSAAKASVAVLGLLVLVLLARLLALLLGDAQLPPMASAGDAQPLSAPQKTTPLAQWHLFGLPGNAATPSSETALALVLRGTIAGSDPRQGTAFIADAQGKEARYRVGDRLPGGAQLDAVYPGRVLLINNGQRETLSLRGMAAGAGSAARPADPVATAPARPDGGFLSGPMAFGSPDLETQRAQRAPDLEALAERANVLPVLENGRMIGVRVSVPDPALLDRVGLLPGDIILSVNGIALDDPTLAPALQNQLRAGGLLTLTVRRSGQDLTLSLGL